MKPIAEQNLYELLEVSPDAPEEEITRAWERAESLYGPGSLTTYTLVSPEDSALLAQRLEEAISVLLDPAARSRYDAQLVATPAPTPGRATDSSPTRAQRARKLPPIIPPLATPRPAPAQAAAPPPDAAPAPAAPAASAPEDGAILLSDVAPPPAQPVVSPPFAAIAEVPAAAEPPTPVSADPPSAPRPPRVAPPPPAFERELVVPEGTRFTGEVLRRAREGRGLTLAQVCERTKVARHHLENLESDRYDRLPAPVYLRGILMAVAKELRLDGQKVARSYLEAYEAGLGATADEPPRRRVDRARTVK